MRTCESQGHTGVGEHNYDFLHQCGWFLIGHSDVISTSQNRSQAPTICEQVEQILHVSEKSSPTFTYHSA